MGERIGLTGHWGWGAYGGFQTTRRGEDGSPQRLLGVGWQNPFFFPPLWSTQRSLWLEELFVSCSIDALLELWLLKAEPNTRGRREGTEK